MSESFYAPNGHESIWCYPQVGVCRWRSPAKPGMYLVVFCVEDQWLDESRGCMNAVMDDFGNLVRVQ